MMNDEECLMEEKSVLACATRVIGHSTTNTNYGLSSFSKADIPAYNWLSDELRRKVILSCEHVPTRQGYPVVDWLKQIRSNCDFCETGTMSQTTINICTSSSNYFSNGSNDADDNDDDDDDEERLEWEFKPKGNPEDKLTSSCKNKKENNIESEEVGFSCCFDDVVDSDSENIDNLSNMSESMPDGQFPDTSSHSWSFSELAMYPRRVVCCVNLIRDESGYFTPCETSSLEDLPALKLTMEHDDNDALIICQKFLEETEADSSAIGGKTSIDDSSKILSESAETIPGSCDIVFYEAGYHFVEENNHLHTSNCSSSCSSEPIVMDCENNLSLSNVNGKVNVTFPRFADAAASTNGRWTQTYNDLNSHDGNNTDATGDNNNCKLMSNEQLYKSCDNFDINNPDNTRVCKIGDSDYKSIGSVSSYLQEYARDSCELVEECTSFDDKYVQTCNYENWNTCLTSECSSQSLDDTRTSEFYSPIEFNETAFDEAAGINNFTDDYYYGDDGDEFRQRKGSASSDILMWKKSLLYFNMDDEDDMRQVQAGE